MGNDKILVALLLPDTPVPSGGKCPLRMGIGYESGNRKADSLVKESLRTIVLSPGCATADPLWESHSVKSGYKDVTAVHITLLYFQSRIYFPKT